MQKTMQLRLSLEEEKEEGILALKASRQLGCEASEISHIQVLRRSIDARKADVLFNYKIVAYTGEAAPVPSDFRPEFRDVSGARPIHIVGFGPAGMFAAMRCIELGFKPVVIERGKKVRERRRDIKAINQDQIVDENSNYCFGEGGAGTYSDGKLYTRSLKRGDVRRVFENLVFHGATEKILIEAHPHIGTNKLPLIVQNIRESILKYGGEIHFESRLTDLIISDKQVLRAIRLQDGREMPVDHLILASGHSARDIYELLHKKQIAITAKSFAMGIRVEHPQHIIDSIQYHCEGKRDDVLPAAAYSIAEQVNKRGVYSFCMCPGGFIVPSATAPGEIVVNGMSPSKRDNKFANSGIVVEINAEEDLQKYAEFGALKALEFQKDVEKLAWYAGGRSQVAPAQRLTDFVEGRLSTDLNPTSYQPGLKSAPLHSLLPKLLGSRLRKGLSLFGQKMKGYYTEEANVVGVESRTSAPVRIPRNDKLAHPQISGLYPCGEGGGYAGGIVSAAMDGERCAEAAAAGS